MYKNKTAGANCNCEGEVYLGSTVVDGSGNWTLMHNLNLHPARTLNVTATQSDGSNNTSEFSACSSIPLPVEFMNLSVRTIDGGTAITWITLSEHGNDYFQIERSIDGENFSTIETIKGAGYSRSPQTYEVIDRNISNSGIVYYRILQVDFNGAVSHSPTISIMYNLDAISLIPIPSTKNNGLTVLGITSEMEFKIIDMTGRQLQQGLTQNYQISFEIDIKPGHYYIELQDLETRETHRTIFIIH